MKSITRANVPIAMLILLAQPIFTLSVEEVGNELVCQCGCQLVLSNCNHVDCGSALPMREFISQRIELGDSKADIVALFVSQYGEAVLSAPPAKGFNLTVWVLPFLGILVGAAVLSVALVSWSRRRKAAVHALTQPKRTKAGDSSRYTDILERELREFD